MAARRRCVQDRQKIRPVTGARHIGQDEMRSPVREATVTAASMMVRLSGRTEDELVEQLIWRTIGPHPANDRRRRAVLRWAGLRGSYVITQDIAAEHHVSRQRVSQWIVATVAAAPDVELTPGQLAVLTAATLPRQDPKIRARRARLFRRPPPPALPSNTVLGWRSWNEVAARITAALGPLTLEQIHAGVIDGRRRRGRHISLTDMHQALDGHGALTRTGQGRWQPTVPTPPLPIDAAIVALVRAEESQPIPYGRMRDILTAVGLNPARSGGGPVMQYHPLVFSVSYGWWALRDYPTV